MNPQRSQDQASERGPVCTLDIVDMETESKV